MGALCVSTVIASRDFRGSLVVSLHLKNRVVQRIGGSKRPYENAYGARAGRTTPLGDVVAVPVYSSARSQSPSESGFAVTTIVSPITPLSDDIEAMPRRSVTRHCPGGPRVRSRNGISRALSTGNSFGDR